MKWLRSERSLGSWRFALACLGAMVLVVVLMVHSAESAGAQTTTTEAPTTTTEAPTTTTIAPECDGENLTLEQEQLCSIAYNAERSRAEIIAGFALVLTLGGAAFIAGLWLKA